MKLSDLKMTGEQYRMTPSGWGESCIMIDEDAVAANMAEAFDIDVDKCDPDADPNDRPEMVEIAIDDAGRFYAVQEMTTAHGYGRVKTVPRYYFRPCENPADAQDGAVSLLGKHWETFDDDDDDY